MPSQPAAKSQIFLCILNNVKTMIECQNNDRIHSAHSPTPFLLGGGVETPTKFSKMGGLTGLQLLEVVAGKEWRDCSGGLQFLYKKQNQM